MRPSYALAAVLVALLYCLPGLTGCRSVKPEAVTPLAVPFRPYLLSDYVLDAVKADTLTPAEKAVVKELVTGYLARVAPDSLLPFQRPAAGPQRSDFAPGAAGERRYVRALKATRLNVKAKSGAVVAIASDVTAATGKRAVVADSGAQVVGKATQVAQAGAGATISQTNERPAWVMGVAVPVLAAGLLLWLVLGVIERRNDHAA